MAKRSYFIEPPELPVLPDAKGNDQGFRFSLPAFMYKRKTRNPLLQYLEDVVAWAEKEYETARLFYIDSGDNGRLAWINGLKAHHVLARSELVIPIFELFDQQPGVWDSLDAFEQNFFVYAWRIWNSEKMSYESSRQAQRLLRKKPTKAKLEVYDDAIKDLLMFNRAYPGPLSASQLTDAAIAGMA